MQHPTPTDASHRPAGNACRIGARGVSRSFGPVRANVEVTLEVARGTVHAIVGENGAGKSTLMRILYGLDTADSGTVVIDDEPVVLTGPRDAIARRIGLVQQELAIIPELSLLENLVLGAEPTRAVRIDWAAALDVARTLERSVGVQIDWAADAAHTSVAIQQQVEILRLVYRGADVLILDEPTAVLAPAQAEELLALLASLRDGGRTVLFISHKLDEVIDIADHITVLRSGRTVGSFHRGEIDRDELTTVIIGDGEVRPEVVSRGTPGEVVLEVEGLSTKDDRGIPRVIDVGFSVRSGEILGVAAVAGNGQEELADAIVGIRAASGRLRLGGRDISGASVRRRRMLGVGYVSPDRKHEGLALHLTLADNAVATPDVARLSRAGWLSSRRMLARAQAVLTRAAVRYGSLGQSVATLSGGNQQRVVLGRETFSDLRLLVASQPTRGVDVRGIGYIHELLRRARDEGAAIVLFSEELDELIALSDRFIVMHGGHVVAELPAGVQRSEIGARMLGRADTREGQR